MKNIFQIKCEVSCVMCPRRKWFQGSGNIGCVVVHQALKLMCWALGNHHELKPEKVHTNMKCMCKQISFVTRYI